MLFMPPKQVSTNCKESAKAQLTVIWTINIKSLNCIEKKNKKIPHRKQGLLKGSSALLQPLSWRSRFKPN